MSGTLRGGFRFEGDTLTNFVNWISRKLSSDVCQQPETDLGPLCGSTESNEI
jgi:hypothetical protein